MNRPATLWSLVVGLVVARLEIIMLHTKRCRTLRNEHKLSFRQLVPSPSFKGACPTTGGEIKEGVVHVCLEKSCSSLNPMNRRLRQEWQYRSETSRNTISGTWYRLPLLKMPVRQQAEREERELSTSA